MIEWDPCHSFLSALWMPSYTRPFSVSQSFPYDRNSSAPCRQPAFSMIFCKTAFVSSSVWSSKALLGALGMCLLIRWPDEISIPDSRSQRQEVWMGQARPAYMTSAFSPASMLHAIALLAESVECLIALSRETIDTKLCALFRQSFGLSS